MPSLTDLMQQGRKVEQHRPWPRAVVDAPAGPSRRANWPRAVWRLLGLWGEPASVHMAICDERSGGDRGRQPGLPRPQLSLRRPASPAGAAAGAHRQRSVRPSGRGLARSPPLARSRSLGRPLSAWGSHRRCRTSRALSLPARGRRRPAPDRGRPRACRHHRARTFPLHRERRDRGPAGAAPGIYPQGHRGPDGRCRLSRAPSNSPDASRATAPLPMLTRFHAPLRRRWSSDVPERAVWLRALLAELERLANHLGDIGAICNDASFALIHAHCSVLRERVLRAADTAFGHRLMRDVIVPGGVARDLDDARRSSHPGRCWTTSAGASRRWSNSMTTPRRCRIARSIPAYSSLRWPGNTPPAAISAAHRDDPSTRAGRWPILPMTACASRCRCSTRATSTRGSGSGYARSSRAFR